MTHADPTRAEIAAGRQELRAARRQSRALFRFVALFSVFVNALMLTGPLYMLNVYDRVLGSRSVETLVALSVLVGFLYLMMALLDYARGRVMSRAGARFQSALDRRVFMATLDARAPQEAATGQRDLENVQRLITSPVLMALFDLPWTPIFLLGIFIFHPLLGYLAIAGGGLLILLALANQVTTRAPLAEANAAAHRTEALGQSLRGEAEMVQSLGMRQASFDRWDRLRGQTLAASIRAGDHGGTFSAMTRAFRLFLQSAMLGLGAYLVLQDQLTAGAMIAGSILLGRALAPVEILINRWAVVQSGIDGWRSLARLLGRVPPSRARTALPPPRATVEARDVTVVPPGQTSATLRMVSFRLEPGQAMGVIGVSGAGKSTLAKALIGLWHPAGGKIRLDGAALDQHEPDTLGKHIGYLPQRVQLFEGTIKDNIARMSTNPDDAAVVAAAKQAAAHDMILKLPEGYDTPVDMTGGRLSGGQIQRIGLARALYMDPVVLVLDEPNANLDNEGSRALNNATRAMKAAGRAVFIMAHRPAAIQECDLILYLENGAARAFGPRDEIMTKVVANRAQIEKARSDCGAGVA
ncbi:type I secretion system permease/ATPase [Salibaculum sp.]|uniref:type I secretion system permease/ATPase n=1 Tax=Salibaculum sp. TaxID=2855480 RepID=UPI002B496C5F|nr:type I secretion system permease/ATPase [Salibaculum sp.]HKL70888.1 type I secretion system permease/ATPase [Salibaculum sp.]